MLGRLDIIAPNRTKTIDVEVKKWFTDKSGGLPRDFAPYKVALEAVWPGLRKADGSAFIMLAVDVYMTIAEQEKFPVDELSFRVAA